MSALISASMNAAPLIKTKEMLLMGSGIYIHKMTPEIAAQWIGILTPIASKESN